LIPLTHWLHHQAAPTVIQIFISSFKLSGHFDEELVIPIIDNEREDYLLVERMREALQV
jgi:hypothetical protein